MAWSAILRQLALGGTPAALPTEVVSPDHLLANAASGGELDLLASGDQLASRGYCRRHRSLGNRRGRIRRQRIRRSTL